MSRSVALFSLVLAFASFASPRGLAADVRVARSERGELAVTLTVEPARLTGVEQADGRFTEIAIPDLTAEGELGEPALPRFSRFVAVPPGTHAEIVAVESDDAPVALPAPAAYVDSRRRHCGDSRVVVHQDARAYRDAVEAPFATISGSSYAGAVKAALLTFSPVRLTDDGARVARRVTARLRFVADRAEEAAPVSFVGIPRDAAAMYRALFLNAEALPPLAMDNPKRVDFVIAAAKYRDAFQELVTFKEQQGREVRVTYLDEKPSVDDVKRLIAAEYKKPSPPTHTILVGSIDDIPSYHKSDYWSDYPYTLLDAGDYPDLSIARFAAQSDAELKAMIAKIVARETAPRDNGAFLVTSGYETSWCQVNLQFIMDNIFKHSPVPITITKLYASDGAKTDRIIEGYNANPNVVVYDGHGNAKGMTEIPFLIEHLPRLTNTVFPIVFDIACLNSYWPSSGASPRNFAESIVTREGSGAAGILAASHNSGGHDLFRHIFRGSIHDEQAASDAQHGLNEVGSAVLYGKLKYLEQYNGASSALQDNWLFYYHGDPASTIFLER